MRYEVGSRAHAHASFDQNFFFDFRRRKNVGRSCFSISFFSFIYFLFFFKRSKRFFFFSFLCFLCFLFLFAGRHHVQIQKCAELHSPAHSPKSKIFCFILILIVLSSQKLILLLDHDFFFIH